MRKKNIIGICKKWRNDNMRDQQKEKAEIGFWMGVAFILAGILNM
jgi:hypothetical protein